MNTKKLLIIINILAVCLFSVPTTQEIYNNIQKAQDSTTPACMTARVNSILVDKQLRNIPKESITYGKKPFVNLKFKKGKPFRLVVENVTEDQKYWFALYEGILLRSGFLFAVGQYNTYSKFIKKYQMFWMKGDENTPNKIKVVEKDALPGDYGMFYYTADWELLKTEYFENKVKVASLDLEYLKSGSYELVKKIRIEVNRQGIDKVTFELDKFSFDNIPDSYFTGY